MRKVHPSWTLFFEQQAQKVYFREILAFVQAQRALGRKVYPEDALIFNAFDSTPLSNIKVVIIGQDPYHGESQAHGLSFSVPRGVAIPPSLLNIFKELQNEYPAFNIPQHGCLQSWAEQGVLLLNSVLSVEQGLAHSHAKCGWETFTDAVVQYIDQNCDALVFMLWGAHAQKKGKDIDANKHLILKAPHPSPLSAYRGFFDCGHFKQANEWLKNKAKQEIDWMPR